MKHVLLATSILAAAGVAASTARAATTSAPPCTPKLTTIQGHRAAVNCGPATVTLHVGGKTYVFRQGFCEQSKAANTELELNLGTSVVGARDNLGKSRFSLVIVSNKVASVFSAYYGGKKALTAESLITVHGNLPARGTFASKVTFGPAFTGSWDCHGVVWKGP
jgi:hypothetical protein